MRHCFHNLFSAGSVHLAVLLIAGCASEEAIQRYEVPKSDSIQLVDSPAESPRVTGPPTDRMLAAIILNQDQAWFLKGTGSIDQISEEIAAQFDKLIGSLSLASGATKPGWELPEGWSEEPGSGMRAANLRTGDLEFSVTRLGVPDGKEREYILWNVNRWRGQMGLGPLSSVELAQETRKITTADGRDATVVDFLGHLDAGSMPPLAGNAAGPNSPGPASTSPSPRIAYDTPDGWEEQPARSMRKAAFVAKEGERQVEITVISLAGQAGGLLSNVNRWRDQVGLEPLAGESEIESETVRIDGQPATYLRIRGTQQRGMLAAILPHDGQVWFFKLMGDQKVADQHEERFRKFLQSFRFAS